MVRSFAAALAMGGASAQTQIAFVGSGGCDPDEVTCVGGGNAENTIQAVQISRDGQMEPRPDLAIPAGGQPAWFTYYSPYAHRRQQCMFVVRTDMDDIASYRLHPSGLASLVGTYNSGGQTPVHADVLHGGEGVGASVLLVANYHAPNNATTSDGATASSMVIHPWDCSLELADVKPHSGSSVNPDRQGGAHVHSFTVAPYGQHRREAYVCDLGQDKIFSYAVQRDGKLTLSSTIGAVPGAGVRHLAQTPVSRILDDGHQYVYAVTEMGETVNAYVQTECGDAACLIERQSVSLVAEGQSGEGSKACEIVMAPDGNTLYATNRGLLNTVTVFGIENDGTLTQKQQIEAPAYPRGMTLAFDGGLLLVAGQSETELTSYQVKADGTLERAYTITEGLPPHPAAFMMFQINSEEEVKEVVGGACTSDEQALLGDPQVVGKKANDCGMSSYNIFTGNFNHDKFNDCFSSSIDISKTCAECYAATGEYGAKNCKADCLLGWCKSGCLSCTAPAQETLATCTGFTSGTAEPCEAFTV